MQKIIFHLTRISLSFLFIFSATIAQAQINGEEFTTDSRWKEDPTRANRIIDNLSDFKAAALKLQIHPEQELDSHDYSFSPNDEYFYSRNFIENYLSKFKLTTVLKGEDRISSWDTTYNDTAFYDYVFYNRVDNKDVMLAYPDYLLADKGNYQVYYLNRRYVFIIDRKGNCLACIDIARNFETENGAIQMSTHLSSDLKFTFIIDCIRPNKEQYRTKAILAVASDGKLKSVFYETVKK